METQISTDTATAKTINRRSPSTIDRDIATRIRTRRKALGITQTTLADRLGITFQQVQKYEAGTNRLSAGRVVKIAEILETPVTQLLGIGLATRSRGPAGDRALERAISRIDKRIDRQVAELETMREEIAALIHLT